MDRTNGLYSGWEPLECAATPVRETTAAEADALGRPAEMWANGAGIHGEEWFVVEWARADTAPSPRRADEPDLWLIALCALASLVGYVLVAVMWR